MLTNTFIHIQGIGAITEQRLWDSGFRDWESFSENLPIPIPAGRKYFLEKGIEESKRHLANRKPSYFSKLLPSNQSWRLFPEFRDTTVYLDIETTGLDRYFNDITTIALYDGESIQTYLILIELLKSELAKKGFLQIIDPQVLSISGFSFFLDNNFIPLNFI